MAGVEGGQINLREWVAPGVLASLAVAIISWQLNGISSRFETVEGRAERIEKRIDDIDSKIDRRAESIEARIVETNQRIDRGLEKQAEIAAKVGILEGDVAYTRARVDRIADKLQVSAIKGQIFSVNDLKVNPVSTLESAGFEVLSSAALARKFSGQEIQALKGGVLESYYWFKAPPKP